MEIFTVLTEDDSKRPLLWEECQFVDSIGHLYLRSSVLFCFPFPFYLCMKAKQFGAIQFIFRWPFQEYIHNECYGWTLLYVYWLWVQLYPQKHKQQGFNCLHALFVYIVLVVYCVPLMVIWHLPPSPTCLCLGMCCALIFWYDALIFETWTLKWTSLIVRKTTSNYQSYL